MLSGRIAELPGEEDESVNHSIHRYFQVGILQWMSFPKSDPLDSLNIIAADDFFDAVEIRGYDTPAQREQARELLRQSHMHISYATMPRQLSEGLNVNAVDEAERRKAESALLEAVDEAASLGAKGIAFMAGKWNPSERDAALQQLLKTTHAVCDYAAKKQMTVELEVFDYDVDKSVLMGPAPLVAAFAGEVRKQHANFGILVDLSHIPLTHETSESVIHTLRPYISHFHIGNAVTQPGCDAYGDKHPRFGYPNSANDVPELLAFFRVLQREGFFRPDSPYVLSIEVTPRPWEDEAVVLAGTKRTIRRAWSLLNAQNG